MSLSYHSEHLAWQQRVQQELSRATSFVKPSTGDANRDTYSPSKLPGTGHKSSNVNLAYTFGGFTPVRYAYKDPATASFSVYADTRDHGYQTPEKTTYSGHRTRSVGVNTKQAARPKSAISPQKKYIQELQTLLSEEKRKREATEAKLRSP